MQFLASVVRIPRHKIELPWNCHDCGVYEKPVRPIKIVQCRAGFIRLATEVIKGGYCLPDASLFEYFCKQNRPLPAKLIAERIVRELGPAAMEAHVNRITELDIPSRHEILEYLIRQDLYEFEDSLLVDIVSAGTVADDEVVRPGALNLLTFVVRHRPSLLTNLPDTLVKLLP